jgi:hypothetical protein
MRRGQPLLGTLVLIVLLLACSHSHLDRCAWQRLPPEQKTLYVRTLLGHEKAKEAKGGNDRVYPAPAEEYARRIDRAYALGETRDVDAVFEEMGERR